jgi:hypothetical protein
MLGPAQSGRRKMAEEEKEVGPGFLLVVAFYIFYYSRLEK